MAERAAAGKPPVQITVPKGAAAFRDLRVRPPRSPTQQRHGSATAAPRQSRTAD